MKKPAAAACALLWFGGVQSLRALSPPGWCADEVKPAPAGFSIAPSSGGVSSSALAMTPDGLWLLAVNPDSASMTMLLAASPVVQSEVRVGAAPQTVAVSPDGRLAYVANQGDGTISLIDLIKKSVVQTISIGGRPYGVVAGRSGIFVSDAERWEIIKLEPRTLRVVSRVPVAPFPMGLALTGDERHILSTHHLSGTVTVLDASTMRVSGAVGTGLSSGLSQQVVLSPDGKRAYLPQTRSNPSNTAPLFDGMLWPIVNVLDLSAGEVLNKETLFLDSIDRSGALPLSAALSSDGAVLFAANAASNDISIINLRSRTAKGHIDIGAFPNGLVLSKDGRTLYANNTLDGTLSVIDVDKATETAWVPITRILLSAQVLRGKRLFHSSASPRLSRDKWISCASCHAAGGGADGRTWLGLPDGPRNTPALWSASRTMPLHWSGDFGELQDVEKTIRTIQGGTGLMDQYHDAAGSSNAGVSEDLDALVAYLRTLDASLSPCAAPDGSLRAPALRGQAHFKRLGCATCHAPPLYTDRSLHEVGTGDPALERNRRGTTFDTPSLLGLWATSPYFHDGSAGTLREVLKPAHPRRAPDPHAAGSRLTSAETADLILFLRSLPYRDSR